ncbi:MAG: response regulator [Rhodothermaceae bacterium]|nr:response regulator [Rhodothermaceae bacterium]
MSARCIAILFILLISPGVDQESTLLFAQSTVETVKDATPETADTWWTPARFRYISLGLLLGIGGSLIWVSILRSRMRAQLETIQFYEGEVTLLKEESNDLKTTKTDFYLSIGEEITSPLDDIKNSTALLQETLFDENQLSLASSIHAKSDSLQLLVDSLHILSQLEARTLKPEFIPVTLQQCIKDSIKRVLPRATEKELELSYTIEAGVPLAVETDPNYLSLILTSLLSNGIKTTEQGSVSVHVQATQHISHYELAFAISDTGIGIPEELLLQLNESLTHPEDYRMGGINLAVCQRLSQLMEGQIGVESTVGNGSTFFFTFPVQEAVVVQSETHSNTEPINAPIALVDPNRITRKIATKFFNRLGHEVAEFTSIESLLPHLDSAPCQYIFVDINEVDTTNLMVSLMDLTNVAEDTPITVIAEIQTGEHVAALKALGVKHVISKPVQLKELEDIVQVAHSTALG